MGKRGKKIPRWNKEQREENDRIDRYLEALAALNPDAARDYVRRRRVLDRKFYGSTTDIP